LYDVTLEGMAQLRRRNLMGYAPPDEPRDPLDPTMREGDLVEWTEGGTFNWTYAEGLVAKKRLIILFGHEPNGARANMRFWVEEAYFLKFFKRAKR
jgi:hypothetical protein